MTGRKNCGMTDSSRKILIEGHELFFAEPPDHRGAAERYAKVIALSPDWGEGHQWLGAAYEALGDEDRAATEYQAAHELDPDDSRPIISLGILRTRQQHFDEAITLLKRGVSSKPHYGFADAKLFLAEAFEGARKIEQAQQQWQEVLELESMYPSYDEPMKQAREKLRLHGRPDKS